MRLIRLRNLPGPATGALVITGHPHRTADGAKENRICVSANPG